MKPPSEIKAFLGFTEGDRVMLDHWKMLKGGMSGTVTKVFSCSLVVHMDSGAKCRVEESNVNWLGLRRMRASEGK